VHIPKNGGTSISLWFKQLSPCTDCIEVGYHSTLAELNAPNDYTTIAVVRNPWDRMISFYHYWKWRERVLDLDFDYWIKNIHKMELSHDKSKPNKLLRNQYWFTPSTPQTIWIHKDPTLLLRFEDMKQNEEVLQELVDCDVPIPKLNATVHNHYTEYYTDETRKIVDRLFALDIERWNYTF
jgi:hypothetical protein